MAHLDQAIAWLLQPQITEATPWAPTEEGDLPVYSVSSGSAIAEPPVRLETGSPGFQHHVAKGHVKVPALLILAS